MSQQKEQRSRLASSQLSAWRFSDRVIAFSGANAMVGIACWKLHARPVVAITAIVNSFLCLMGLTMQAEYPALANGYVCLAACNSAAQYGLHMAKVPSLHHFGIPAAIYSCWMAVVAAYAVDRLSWTIALRGDS
jgi:hypothetical protein